ncbi:sodium-dependent lysophosphatidylcholine symporter 1-like [Gigantopelta aegis]|uniref:sodium-dependent lysophosphatidylcholine symporter 1-like n=1 Tax=Gigantopelta aegis TaxID=1735272 RepID=UPI001B88980C|nr:sodium-dependent lysophosphatidylcholine symporter 1-like [Gigantopelta aegis]
MCISSKQVDRDSATAYRMVSEGIGVLLAILIQGKLIERVRTAGHCSHTNSTAPPHSLAEQKWSYTLGSVIVIIIYVVCIIAVFFGVKEKIVLKKDRAYSSYFKGIKTALTYGPFVKASMVFLFCSLAMAIVQGNIALYCTHTLKLVHFSNFIMLALVTSVISMPVWQCLLIRFGKKKIYATGMIIFIPVALSQFLLPENASYAYYIVVCIAGLSISVSLLLPWSILPDVLDLYLVERQERKDAIFYSFYVFFNKLATGLGLGISQVVLELGGYVTGACAQPESVSFTLRLLMTCPAVFMLGGLLILWTYPIDERKRREIQLEVQNRDPPLTSDDVLLTTEDTYDDAQETKFDDK